MNMRKIFFLLGVLLISLCAASQALGQKYIPKVDNFLLLYDGSGSMKFNYMDTGENKAVLAKKAMLEMNSDIPGLDYQSGLVELTSDYKVYQDHQGYDEQLMAGSVADLKEPQSITGYFTPLEKSLLNLESILDNLSGRTALILFADGQQNMSSDALSAAKALYAKYDICLHVVSYAQNDREHALLNKINALNNCSYMISGQDMGNDAKRKEFVQNVLYDVDSDSDGDGVFDRHDECPGTPAGVEVDEVGCPIDSDADGVPDSRDECPGTPAGVEVDNVGCPVDSDADGVPDYKDECPRTAQGIEVDDRGCPVTQQLRLRILFDFDKTEIKPEYRSELQRIATYLANHPDKEINIEGHTDSIGPKAYNMDLSQRRADRVQQYLVREFGVKANRLTPKGYGESRPVASNDTEEGRHKNRRVVCNLPGAYEKE